MAAGVGRIGARMREALRLLYGAGREGLLRMELVAELADRGGTSDAAAYATIRRLVEIGLVEVASGLVVFSPLGVRYISRRITWWGGPL